MPESVITLLRDLLVPEDADLSRRADSYIDGSPGHGGRPCAAFPQVNCSRRVTGAGGPVGASRDAESPSPGVGPVTTIPEQNSEVPLVAPGLGANDPRGSIGADGDVVGEARNLLKLQTAHVDLELGAAHTPGDVPGKNR